MTYGNGSTVIHEHLMPRQICPEQITLQTSFLKYILLYLIFFIKWTRFTAIGHARNDECSIKWSFYRTFLCVQELAETQAAVIALDILLRKLHSCF